MPPKALGTHERPVRGKTNDWITPRLILDALGPFDLDPCASLQQPWPCAARQFTIEDDGLRQEWFGRVWCNPPYGDESGPFLARLAEHGNGIALIFARTETRVFFEHVWGKADGLLFLKGRLKFFSPSAGKLAGNCGAPSVLVAYGIENVDCLRYCGLPGSFVPAWRSP